MAQSGWRVAKLPGAGWNTLTRFSLNRGYNLTELMIGLMLGGAVLVGMIQIFSSSRQSYEIQTGQYSVQQSGQFALQFLAREIRQAGYVNEPWLGESLSAVTDTSVDNGSSGDQLALQYYSDRNCFGSKNPPAENGRSPVQLKQLRFGLRESQRQLTWWCAYGPAEQEPQVQINNQTLVDNIDSFQVLYGEDSDRDGNPDQWVNAGDWASPENVAVITLALLVAGEKAAPGQTDTTYQVLDYDTGPLAGSGKRELMQTSVALRNYLP